MTDFYQLAPEQQAIQLEALARHALPYWGISTDADLRLLKHRENAVFKVVDADGTRYALRVHRYDYHSDAALGSELRWMTALNDSGLLTPAVVPTNAGELFKVVAIDTVPEPRQCDLISWVEGEPLGSIEQGVEGDMQSLVQAYRTIGELAACLHAASNAWELPANFTRQAWDEDGLLGDTPLWGRFWELEALTEEQKDLLLQARDKARQQLLALGKGPDRYGLIHCDFLPENLLQTPQGFYLIDFDDSGFGWHLFEFATSLFFHLGETHFDAVRDAMLQGYRSVRPLSDEQLAYLPTFFLIRGLVYLGWAHTRRETETAQALTPMMIAAVTQMAQEFIEG